MARNRYLRWALAASLAVNLLVLGAVLGMTWRFGGPDRPEFRAPVAAGALYTRALSQDERRLLVQQMRGTAPREDILRNYNAMLAALRSEPFDPDAVRRILSEQGAQAQARVEAGRAVLSDHLISMEPDARSRYADRLEEILLRGRHEARPD